jgi:hypothetical protein
MKHLVNVNKHVLKFKSGLIYVGSPEKDGGCEVYQAPEETKDITFGAFQSVLILRGSVLLL